MSVAPDPVDLLAFDTSTERMAVAVQAAKATHAVNTAGGAAASASLLPQVHALLAQAGISLQQLQAIAFGHGPGAFTGLRTACAVAQGLGLGLHKPLLPIDSLLIVAEDARQQAAAIDADFDVLVAMDARMDEVYAGRYLWRARRWQVQQMPALMSLPALQQALAEAPLQAVAGSAWSAFGARLPLPSAVMVLAVEQDRASALMRLAQQAHARGEGLAAADALPLYLRDKVAHTTAERAAMKATA
jgi:tRNA threonylcarbamoyladenosine biosynthesis protein TsaB